MHRVVLSYESKDQVPTAARVRVISQQYPTKELSCKYIVGTDGIEFAST